MWPAHLSFPACRRREEKAGLQEGGGSSREDAQTGSWEPEGREEEREARGEEMQLLLAHSNFAADG